MFICNCRRSYTHPQSLNRHYKSCGCAERDLYKCLFCTKEFTRKDNMTKHCRLFHSLADSTSSPDPNLPLSVPPISIPPASAPTQAQQQQEEEEEWETWEDARSMLLPLIFSFLSTLMIKECWIFMMMFLKEDWHEKWNVYIFLSIKNNEEQKKHFSLSR